MDNNEKKQNPFTSRAFRIGGYGLLITAIVVAVVIALNFFFAQLPSSFTKPSISAYDLYEISGQTEQIVKGIKDKVTVYQIAETGKEDEVIAEFIRRYSAMNGKIGYKTVDPVVHPNFVKEYTVEELSENSLIVVNDATGVSKSVDYSEIFTVTFSSQEEYYYYMMGMGGGTTMFAGENALTSALDYVSSSSHPTVYYTTGHGEASLSQIYQKHISDDNIMLGELNLLTAEKIPEDASLVMIYAPQTDFRDTEIETLRAFIAKGGKMMLISDTEAGELPKIYALMAEYGLSFKPGVIMEGDMNHYYSSPLYLLPSMTQSGIAELMSSTNVNIIMPFAHPIALSDEIDSSVWVTTKLFSSTVSSYNKTNFLENKDATIKKEEGDEEGPFTLGVMLENLENGASVTWFSSPYLFDDSLASIGNGKYVIASLNYLCEKEASVSIAAKSLAVEQLIVSGGAQVVWFVLLVIILPLGIVIIGLMTWLKRRKR